ncbi:MBL fold metallo-hydrolase [Rhizobium sp. P32RR-XVIII]|nr:MBL fold metallo-hydrolase [Rhizobium sp. P32RR-XVIII]
MTVTYDILMSGFPGRSGRGFLGWSTIVLLHTPEGCALFDTGSAGDRPGPINALAARNIPLSAIRTVILSHLHFDHIGNAECFRNADFLLHENEFAYFENHGTSDAAVPQVSTEFTPCRGNAAGARVHRLV